MSQVIYHARVALLLLFICCSTQAALAQIAPTNSATISGSVSDSAGKPVANAKVSLSGPKSTSTQTDAQGLFVFVSVPFGTYDISAIAAGLGTANRVDISVQADTNVAIQYEPVSANEPKVIANVSSNAHAQFNVTPASVAQVNPIAQAFEGKTSWRTILEQIPGVAQAGLGIGSYISAAYPDGPLTPVRISINGALPYETATLLDDMPIIGSGLDSAAGAGTDLSVYPLNGFGAADVVRGPGASSPSIVDSIGGSFVLHAPGVVNQNHSMLSLSTDPYGGIIANILTAVRWKKLSVVVTYGVNDSPGPTNQALIPADTFSSPSTVNGSSFLCTGLCAQTALYSPGYASASFPLAGYRNGLLVCCYQASTAWSQHSGSIALHYDISPDVSFDVSYAGQSSNQSEPYPDDAVTFTPPAGYTGSLPAGEQLLSTSGVYLASYPIQLTSSLFEEKVTARLGNGILRLAALQNRIFDFQAISTPTSATLQLFGGGCIASSPGGTGGCSAGYAPIVFNGGTYNVTYSGFNEVISEGSNNRDLLLEYTTPLGGNLRAGASFVRSYYDTPCSFTYSTSSFSLIGSYSSASQTTNELRVFVGATPSDKTSIDLSEYFVNAGYHVPNPSPTSVGYVNSQYTYDAPRLGFVWRPTAAVAVRASAGGGFAEAPLGDLVGSNGNPNCLGGTYCTVTLTNLNLQPEKSFAFDLGTDLRLRRNMVVSFDVYRSNLYGQLYKSTLVTGTYLGLPLYSTQWGNLGESRYEGVLLDLRHDVPHGIYWAFSGGLTRGYVVSVPAGFYNTATCTNCNNLTVVPGINFNGQFTGVSVPYSQALGTFGYRWNSEKYIDLVGTYYGNNNTYFRPAFVELDGHIGYPLSRHASLLVTFRNITGIYDSPTQIRTPDNLSGSPTISGLPYVLYGEMYGPRTVLLTSVVRL